MLDRVDRVQLAVRDGASAAQTFFNLLGAGHVRDDHVRVLGARRSVVQAGESEFELLEPDGEGPVARHLERWGEGIFAGGFSSPDLQGLARRLEQRGVQFAEEGQQLFIEPEQTRGMRMVISPAGSRQDAGLITGLYEVTNIVQDHKEAAAFYAGAFGLDASRFCPVGSEQYGYTGTLTMFNPPQRLDRIELTQITEPTRAMGRFFARRGPSIYMCYAETPDVAALQQRLRTHEARFAGDPGDPERPNLFIHPSSLHGMLMGVSRTNFAWTWSGRPELARTGG